ncbi:cinnamoyl-CoA reductase 1-like isoform X2 [Punica granatum]|uniref:Cinnamoyl-CoA reductase 1-like isoform X2 n=1 Tax=Punica granatum TaxID=22663 RepID=A0A218X069_PUNGR|nr:cinnamoyl-CoA reductase 1-like isoform X2 [Punica granatum]OWM78397.1 hypothetical protein CDL15_Pgr016121 [Punica granatum]
MEFGGRTEREKGGKKKEVVCVTGASGFIASWLVKLLLERGYTVKATVRNPNDPKKTEHLRSLHGAKERLHLFGADLLEDGSFDSVVEGCTAVFHTASPVSLSPADPKAELIDPAVKGTLNVLSSCVKTPTVRRVVVTSSIVSVAYNGKPLTSDVVVDETWFSDPAFCEESKLWYVLSKTLAEEAAWKFAKEKSIDMVTLHPGIVIGPILQPTLNISTEIFLNLINGGQTFPNASYRLVDVRDVGEAHIVALESLSANGRYNLVADVVHASEVLRTVRKLYPTMQLPGQCSDDKPFEQPYRISKERAEGLGVRYIPLDVSYKDTIQSLKEKGFLSI